MKFTVYIFSKLIYQVHSKLDNLSQDGLFAQIVRSRSDIGLHLQNVTNKGLGAKKWPQM